MANGGALAVPLAHGGPGHEFADGVVTIDGQRPDAAFDDFAIEVDAAVVEEAREVFPASERVADQFAELGLGADLAVPRIELLVQIIDDDAAALIAD